MGQDNGKHSHGQGARFGQFALAGMQHASDIQSKLKRLFAGTIEQSILCCDEIRTKSKQAFPL